jgi:hypothetical protein
MMPLSRTCRDVAALLVAQEDRRLGLADRLALRLHLAMCETCPKFERQLLTMRNQMRLWRAYTDEETKGSP